MGNWKFAFTRAAVPIQIACERETLHPLRRLGKAGAGPYGSLCTRSSLRQGFAGNVRM